MDFIIAFLVRWGWFLVAALGAITPLVADYKTGEYRGFKQAKLLYVLPLLLAGGLFFAWLREETWSEISVTMAVGCTLLYIIARIDAEILFRLRSGTWRCNSPHNQEPEKPDTG